MSSRSVIALLAMTACGRIGFGEQAPTDGGAPWFIALELPEGGAMTHVAIAPSGTWYVGSQSSGAYRSRDQGASWEPCASGPPATGIAVGADNAVYLTGGQMRVSDDECDSFTTINTMRYSNDAGRAGAFVYALTDQGIERRPTGGAWTTVLTMPGTAFGAFAAREGANELLLAGSQAGVYRSDDGAVWTPRTTGFATSNILGVAVGATRTYAIAGSAGTSSGGISCGDLDGAVWTVCMPNGGTAIAVDPLDDEHVIAAVYDELGETTDGFMTMTLGRRGAGGMSNAIVTDLKFTPAGDLIVASRRGVFVSPAGEVAFQPRNTGLAAWTPTLLVRDGDDLFVATSAGLARSIGGAPFSIDTRGIPNDTAFLDVALAPSGDLVGIGRGIWRSTDRGETWTLVHAFPAVDEFHGYAIELGANGRIYAGTTRRLVMADPPYSTWTPREVGAPDVRTDTLLLHEGALWAGTSMGLVVATVAQDLASDVAAFTRIAAVDGDINQIAVLAGGGLLVGTSTGVWTSDAQRVTWTQRMARSTRDVLRDGAITLAATSEGVYASRDDGETWTLVPESAGLGTDGLAIDPGNGDVIYGIAGRGLARAAIP